MNRTKVVLADDHAILREGLRALISIQADLEVVGEAATGLEAIDRVQETIPRVLCLDLSMPGWGSGPTIARVNQVSPRTRVLVLTMHNDPAYVRSALAAGAAGYFLKSSPSHELLAAIRATATGARVIDSALQGVLEDAPPPAGLPQFSRRETEVLEHLVKGHTHQEIADLLFLSVKTVETYRARLREKTGLKSRADFVRYGLDAGLLNAPEAVTDSLPED
ncbi:response regulator transcription factor [Gemmata sp. G18]|uniref:Response regulator transcription factor n=1 Tax=Gemmata palustris TaxID=2822762 RepID=A0ABS5BXI1_9BACT|nr:response regulator transcription factor [Gemmata palustris]MBP3958450.1 response regulator transcription factor [Gemmata palustris]